jgi:hypothetical protein
MKTHKLTWFQPVTVNRTIQVLPSLIALTLTVFAVGACSPKSVSTSHWPMHTIDNTFEGADGVDASDIDGDGDVDLVVGWEESGQAALYENPGARNVLENWHRTNISVGLDVRKIEDAQFADFNSDGKIDAVVSATENRNEKVNIHWLVDRNDIFNNDSWKSASIVPSIQLPFIKVAIGQIDGSGANFYGTKRPRIRIIPIRTSGKDGQLLIFTGLQRFSSWI